LDSFIIGTTYADLRHIYNATAYQVANFYAVFYGGLCLGSLVYPLYKYANRQLLLVFFVLIVSVTIALTPHYGNLWIAYGGMVLNGIGCGAWDAGTYLWLIEVWPSRIAELFQVSKFTYNLGATISAPLTRPFVLGDAIVDQFNRTITIKDRRRALSIPYSLLGYIHSISKSQTYG